MTRVTGLVLAFASAVSAAPRPADRAKAPVYFPTTVGERWKLAVVDADDARVLNYEEVIAVSEKDDITTITVARLKPDGTRRDEYTVEASAEGVAVVAAGKERLPQPDWLVKLKPGAKWEMVEKPGRAKAVLTMVGEEDVETPAGKFKAVKVETEFPEGTVTRTEWYAPGRGRVQQVSDGRKVQLTEVTPAKK